MEHALNKALFIILPNLTCFFTKTNSHFVLVHLVKVYEVEQCASICDKNSNVIYKLLIQEKNTRNFLERGSFPRPPQCTSLTHSSFRL